MLTPAAPSPVPKYVANASGTGVVVEGDPSGSSHATIPTPELLAELNGGGPGLGTHVVATVLGAGPHSVGIAPGSKFVSAAPQGAGTTDVFKGLSMTTITGTDILKRLASMTAPNGPAGATVPDVVNNSWGGTSYSWA